MKKLKKIPRYIAPVFAVFVLVSVFIVTRPDTADATCTQAVSGSGTVTSTVSVPSSGTYRVWSRIMAADSQNNSYFLEIDNDPCIVVGDNSAISSSSWTWVNYRDGNTSSPISVSLTAGNHTFKMIGREAGVKLDRIILTTDTACTPTGTGENCANPADTTPPSVTMTAPANNATISGSVTVSANASDDVGVTKVEFYRSGSATPLATRNSAPYSFSFNTTTLTNGAYTLYAKAYDAANNTKNSTSISVTISNPEPEPEIVPGDVNGSGCVDMYDLSTLITNFNRSSANRSHGDVNSDGSVNIFDLSIILSNWGTGC